MNLKAKTFGFVAGTALAFSLVTGVMAQGTTEATLTDNNGCTAGSLAGDIDLGSYSWNGTSYDTVAAASGTVETGVVDNKSYDAGTCNVSVTFSSLTGSTSSANVIPAGALTIAVENASGVSGTASPYTVNDGTALELSATLTNPNNHTPDLYSGTVTLGTALSNG